MTAKKIPAVGIDLGTTYSAVAVLDDLGRPTTLLNSEGDKLTPSAVLFEGTQTVVGKEAIKALATDADNVAQFAKRELGSRVFHKMLGNRQYPPEAILAMVLNKLRLDATRQIGPFEKAVITVPAYFDEVRRKATQDAGYMAGLDVIDIINEPTAAAVAFGFSHGLMRSDGSVAQRQRVLVYDLGGGTFDVTVMELDGKDFVALATDGDVHLGGHDWDYRLIDSVAEEFIRRYGMDPREEPTTAGRLWRDCEDAKRTLSARSKALVSCDYRGQALRLEITREWFQDITRDLVDRTAFTTRQTLQAAGLDWPDIDRVLLIGGSTRMPGIHELIKSLSGKEPDCSVSADEAVCHGAALRAGLILAQRRGEEAKFRIKNVNSHSLGVVGYDSRTKRARNAILIPRNTSLPVTAKRVFKTQKAAQRSILVQIVEGESATPEDCSQIGKCSVRDLPANLPSQTPIEVRFHYEENGRLRVMVQVVGTDANLHYEITRENSLTNEQLDMWRQYISGQPPANEQRPQPPDSQMIDPEVLKQMMSDQGAPKGAAPDAKKRWS